MAITRFFYSIDEVVLLFSSSRQLWIYFFTTFFIDPTGPAIIMMDENVIEGRTGTFYVSFAPLQLGFTSINETDDYRSILEPNATFAYSVRSSTVGCYWFNEETTEMTTEGCKVSGAN